MNFLDLITERNNYFIDTVERMKKNGKPLVLIGAGCLGEMTWDFLQRQHTDIDLVGLNEKYITPDFSFHHAPVISVEELIEGSAHYNYIIALQIVDDEMLKLLKETAKEILVFDPAFIGVNTTKYYTADFCLAHAQPLSTLYNELSDDKSRATMVAFINQRICAERSYCHTVYEAQHYFPQDVVQLKDNEIFIDCGAYNGDSIEAFMAEITRQNRMLPQRIIAFEPDDKSFSQLVENTRLMDFCECINKGVWDKESVLYFHSGKELSSHINSDASTGNSIIVGSIDATLQGNAATFIKMDVEGSELKALHGAADTIKSYQPVLAISVYHKPEDLVTIPQFIKSLSPNYRFYLRAHHPELSFELVLYAIPVDRVVV